MTNITSTENCSSPHEQTEEIDMVLCHICEEEHTMSNPGAKIDVCDNCRAEVEGVRSWIKQQPFPANALVFESINKTKKEIKFSFCLDFNPTSGAQNTGIEITKKLAERLTTDYGDRIRLELPMCIPEFNKINIFTLDVLKLQEDFS